MRPGQPRPRPRAALGFLALHCRAVDPELRALISGPVGVPAVFNCVVHDLHDLHTSHYPSIYVSMNISIYPPIYSSMCSTIHLHIYLGVHPSIYPCVHVSIYLSTYPPFNHPSIHQSFNLHIYLGIYPCIHLSIYLSIHELRWDMFHKLYVLLPGCAAPSTGPAVFSPSDLKYLLAHDVIFRCNQLDF